MSNLTIWTFLNFDFFETKEDKDELKQITYKFIHEKIIKLCSNFKGTPGEFFRQNFGKNNSQLFYLGLENDIEESFSNQRTKIKNYMEANFDLSSSTSGFCKTKISTKNNAKGKSLLSFYIFKTINRSSSGFSTTKSKETTNFIVSSNNSVNLYIFPLCFNDFH